MKDLFPWLCFIVCVWTSHGFRLGTGSCNVTKLLVSDSRVPRSNGAKNVPNEFGLSSNFSRACSRKFGTTLIFGLLGFKFWKTENTIDLWKKVLKFRILNSEFPHRTLEGCFEDFRKTEWQNLPTMFCWSFNVLKFCHWVLTKILYFSQAFSQFPFLCA